MNPPNPTDEVRPPGPGEALPQPVSPVPAQETPSAPESAQRPTSPDLPEIPRREKGKDAKEKDKEKDRDKEREKSREKEKKKKKKEKDETRKADAWQRYKAMLDALKSAQDLVDLADHKARFALMIMGALNAAILLAGTRAELLAAVPSTLRPWLYLYFGIYVTIAIYFLLQAIESLRPRRYPPLPRKSTVSEKDESLGLRFFAEAIRYDRATYMEAWNSVRVSQLNAEIAGQLHTIAKINDAKYAAVSKLYVGLKAITVLTAGLLLVMGELVWLDSRVAARALAEEQKANGAAAADGTPVKVKAGKPGKGGWAILGEPERFSLEGVKEPSGIAWVPARGTFYVVGDDGSLVESSKEAKALANVPTGGNLEDVAFHAPSGRLVLLSEKKGELLVVDPATGRRTGKFKLDVPALVGEAIGDVNQGFEGLTFRPEAGRAGGGVFYITHQRLPALMVAVSFDPTAAKGTIGVESLIGRTPIANRQDLTAVTWDASLERLFVIADSKDRLVMLKASGEEEAEIVLPGVQQEGIAFDPDGNLWVADDQAGLLVFRGARARIATEMKAPHPNPSPTGKP